MLVRYASRLLILLALAVVAGGPVRAQDNGARIVTTRGDASHVAVSPAGNLAAAYADPVLLMDAVDRVSLPIRLYDLTSGQEIGRLLDHTDYVTDVAFTPDGQRLASSHRNGDLNVWDVASRSLIKTIRIDLPGGRQLRFLPDGNTLATAMFGLLPAVQLWDVELAHMVRLLAPSFASYEQFRAEVLEQRMPQDPLIAFDVSADGQTLIGATTQDNVWSWDLNTGVETLLVDSETDVPTLSIRRIEFLGDSQIAGYYHRSDEQIVLLDVDRGEILQTIPLVARVVAFSPDGARFAWTEPHATTVSTATLDHPDEVTTIEINWAVPNLPELAFTPDGTRLVVSGISTRSDDGTGAFAIVPLP